MSGYETNTAILRTKLFRPPPAPDERVREELLAKLDSGRSLPLTLIAAPAGYGKSTIASHGLEKTSVTSA